MGESKPPKRLESWKEISAYLGKDERTAQRWERERGLPIHRLPGGRSNVFAYENELGAWQNGQLAAHHENDPVASKASASDSIATSNSRGRAPSPGGKFLLWMGTIFVLAGLGVVALMSEPRDGRPARATYQGPELVIHNRAGEELWRYRFQGQLHIPDEVEDPWRRIHFADIDADGSVEVLAAIGFQEEIRPGAGDQRELWCFSEKGEVRWSYKFTDTLPFGDRVFHAPYYVRNLLITENPRGIWLSVVHNIWFPSVLLNLDAFGREQARFVNAGYIYSLASLRTETGVFILVGGVNNEFDSGMLAVLDANDPSGRSPQSAKGEYECKSCPEGEPYRYFLFPRSELNRVTDSAYNKAELILVAGNRIRLVTREVQISTSAGAEAVFEFLSDFKLGGARPGDSYWNVHRVLEEENRLDHSAKECPDRNRPLPVREWRDNGWSHLLPAEQDGVSARR